MLGIWLWLAKKLTTGKTDGYCNVLIHTKAHLVKVTVRKGSRYLAIHKSTRDQKFWNYDRINIDTRSWISGRYPYTWVK